MTYTVGIYFLGAYRPAYFEHESLTIAVGKAIQAVSKVNDPYWFIARLTEGKRALLETNTASWAADHCNRGVCVMKRKHDRFLDKVTKAMPHCPGLDYSFVVNV